LVMLFSLLFAGLLLNHDAIPKAAVWLQAVSRLFLKVLSTSTHKA
jgi:hypothetical protein